MQRGTQNYFCERLGASQKIRCDLQKRFSCNFQNHILLRTSIKYFYLDFLDGIVWLLAIVVETQPADALVVKQLQ